MKNFKPLISIIMNCYNGEKYLKKSIKSVINQNYKNWELIFWDNKSSDNSKKILKEFKDNRIKYFFSKKFTNLYEARNLAIKKSKGSYICFLDTDDWWKKKKLKHQIEILKKKKNINFIFSNLTMYDQLNKTKYLYFKKYFLNQNTTQILLDNYKIGILTVMIKRKLFKKYKFNKNFNIVGDFDLFLKMSLNETFYCIQESLAFYRIHNKNYSKKISIYADEIYYWLKTNSYRLKKLGYSLVKLKIFYIKLKVKSYFYYLN